MTVRRILAAMVIGVMAFGTAVHADSWKNESRHGYHKSKHHKKKHRITSEREYEVEYEMGDDYRGPPPWAPAHGYRRKHHERESSQVIVQVPIAEEPRYKEHAGPEVEFEIASQKIGITAGTCDREAVGAVMGGVVGGIIGNKTASRENKTIGTIAGALIGVVLGKELGRRMDKADAQCTSQVLERARDGQAVVWDNPETGHHYSVTPYQTYQQDDGSYCRKYTTTVKDGSNEKRYKETACRSESGMWERKS